MRLKNRISLLVIASTAILGYSNYANAAGTANGQLGVTVNVTAGCTVGIADGQPWATLDFGTISKITADIGADASLASGLNITCTDGLGYKLTFDDGLYGDGAKLRHMQIEAGTKQIPYRLYTSLGGTEILADTEQAYTGTGQIEDVSIYGLISLADQGTVVAPAAGRYNDTVVVTLTW